MKKLNWLCITLMCALTAACGGGTDEPSPLPPVAAPVADVSLVQKATHEVVTPGETFRVTLLQVTCPTVENTAYCKKSVPLGELGFEVGASLQDMKVFLDGQEVSGFFNQEEALYRFTPLGYVSLWQQGTLELRATLSSTASGTSTSTITVKADDASFDKTLAIVQGNATMEVLALPHQAPVTVAELSKQAEPGVYGRVGGFSYSCPATVTAGCTLKSFDVWAYGIVPQGEGSTIVNFQMGEYWNSDFYLGSGQQKIYLDAWVAPGTTMKIVVSGTMSTDGTLWFENIESHSGGKAIAPILPTTCTSVSPRNCKG